MQFPVHSYGTQNIPTMVHQMGQMMFKKKEQERQDKKDLLLLKERQKNTAFDQGMKLLNIYPKYEETAPAAARKIASQAGQFFKASGYEFDLSTLKDAGEAKELVKTQSVERMEAISKTMFKAPEGQALDLGGNINALATSVRQAKQAGVSKEVTDIYEKYIADARKRQAETRAAGRVRAKEGRTEVEKRGGIEFVNKQIKKYKSGIDIILGKYKGLSSGINIIDGQVDMASLLEGKKNAYERLNDIVAKGGAGATKATRDKKALDFWYNKVEGLVGSPIGVQQTGGLPQGMPSAKGQKGKIIRDTETGIRYKSDGINWNEV